MKEPVIPPKRKCSWPEGCSTVLSMYNEGSHCRIHQREVNLSRMGLNEEYLPKNKDKEPVYAEITAQTILDSICHSYQITIQDLLSTKRLKRYLLARQIAAYLLRIDMKKTFSEIAEDLDRKSETVFSFFTRIHTHYQISPIFAQQINQIRSRYAAPD